MWHLRQEWSFSCGYVGNMPSTTTSNVFSVAIRCSFRRYRSPGAFRSPEPCEKWTVDSSLLQVYLSRLSVKLDMRPFLV